jgi:hypothetical protein
MISTELKMQPTHIEKSWILQLKSPAFLEIFISTGLIITLKHPDYFDKIYFTEFGEFHESTKT